MSNERVLAMYDVRGKQDYIYRSNRIKEIMGGSWIIRDVFQDYLYPAARIVRNKMNSEQKEADAIYCYKKSGDAPEDFSEEQFEQRMEGAQYIGEVVYDGGGNFFVLYKNRDICENVNKLFTRELLRKTCTLKVLCSCIEGVDFKDYRGDNRKLRERHRINESQESVIYPVNSLPIVQVDAQGARPLSVMRRRTDAEKPEKMSIETFAKYEKYDKEAETGGDMAGETVLDRIVTEKGRESLLAVIYIDGNQMGAKVNLCLEGKETYEECVNELRAFSGKIQKDYVDRRVDAINSMLDKKYEGKKYRQRRTIIAAGDEINIICNARDALDVVEAYFNGMPEGDSSCAGIAIFHSHAPFADAYRIAEECCESGKQLMKADGLEDGSFVDFHYCQGGIGISLEAIREQEGTTEAGRPWRIERAFEASREGQEGKFYHTISLAREMGALLKQAKRSNMKSLLEYAKESPAKLQMELDRINAHRDPQQQLDFTLGNRLDNEQMRKLIYDVVLVHDLWFGGKEEGNEQEESGKGTEEQE